MYLLSLSWGHCPHWIGVTVVDAQASLQSRRLCCCRNNVFALAAVVSLPPSNWRHGPCHGGIVAIVGIFAIVMMVLLPLLRWRHCQHCRGIVALVVPALSSLSRWSICPNVKWALSLSLRQRCCPRQAGMFVPLRWCSCPCRSGIVAFGALALAPSLHRHLCPCCACVVQSICRHLCPCWAGVY
jgi:hypothetical protein